MGHVDTDNVVARERNRFKVIVFYVVDEVGERIALSLVLDIGIVSPHKFSHANH